MIARSWQARTRGPRETARYHEVFESEVLEALGGVAGFRGACLLARPTGASVEIRTVTLFTSMDAVKAFAGEDHERERVTSPARATLLDSVPTVQHFEVLTGLWPSRG
ncbi:hypothetical protein NE235_09275 [Actinoallomurus spadix]|uniref:ABM domain-containing protein n=1 Tax=Actinoallomurus spadix TaxID=79912 RepID=A0ABP3FYV6_9ACTN|nr:hypothetical protein [Actinoallomurus spadix]MCO5986298.1 hypothetical protein [Actinoallomurus spadix]